MAEQSQPQDNEIVLPASPLGPQWNHSIDKPNAKAVRFGGKINAGLFVANGFTLHGSVWGNFLEEASLVAVGPGMGFLLDSTNIGVDLSVGVGRVLNVIKKAGVDDFAETVLAANLATNSYLFDALSSPFTA